MPKTVGVAVSNATFHFDKLYTYAVLPEHQNAVRLGSMVLVPFGKGSRARMGVVLACDAEPEHSKLKYLFDVAPASACLTPELLRLVHFLKERTFCTYYEAVKAVIRRGMKKGFYQGVNFDSAYCGDCGRHSTNVLFKCPHCGSANLSVISRVCGYLGYSNVNGMSRMNDGKMAEIRNRKSM